MDIERKDPDEARLEAEGEFEREQAELSDKAMSVETAVDAFRQDNEEMVQSLIQEYGVVKFFDAVYRGLGLENASVGHEDLMRLIGYVNAEAPQDEVTVDSDEVMVGDGVEEACGKKDRGMKGALVEDEVDEGMTKQHFEALAARIRSASDVKDLGMRITDWLATVNPRFDRQRFAQAAGLTESEVDEEMSDQALQTARDRISHELNREPRQAHICPECGSDQTEGSGVNVEGAEAQQDMVCNKCAHEWTNQFRLMESEQNGYIAMWNGKREEIYADSLYAAKLKAIEKMKIPKSKQGLLSVTLAEKDGEDVVHTQ